MRTVAVVSLVLLALGLMYSSYPSEYIKPVFEAMPLRGYKVENCTEQLEIECAVYIERTVVACSKAFETEGADVIADIKCAKDLLSDKKFCWPCICAYAKKKGWKVVGC